jgi:hypothetical protein
MTVDQLVWSIGLTPWTYHFEAFEPARFSRNDAARQHLSSGRQATDGNRSQTHDDVTLRRRTGRAAFSQEIRRGRGGHDICFVRARARRGKAGVGMRRRAVEASPVSGVRLKPPKPATERRAIALAASGAPAFWTALDGAASELGAAGTTVVVPRMHAPAMLGPDAFARGVSVLVEPADRGTGQRLLLALAGLPRPSRDVAVLVGAAAVAWRASDRLLERLELGFHGAERNRRGLVLVAGNERPLERWFLFGSEAALVSLFEATYPCLLRRARFAAQQEGADRVRALAAMYRELSTLDLVDDVLRGADDVSVLGLEPATESGSRPALAVQAS